MQETVSYKPSAYYFRSALRSAEQLEDAIEIGLTICGELERLKAWVREQGMYPPKWVVAPEEAAVKGIEPDEPTSLSAS